MSKMTKMAEKDAERWAYAEMFFGEGAGTRRKLVGAEVMDKQVKIPGYWEAFEKAYEKLDKGDIALEAARDRKRIDRKKKRERNIRGLTTGNLQTMTTGLAAAAALYGFAKQTGLDEPIKREVKKQHLRLKARIRAEKAAFKEWRRDRKTYAGNVTDLR